MRWFLPVLFISYMAGITLFTHSHVVNGVTIVHSHPFKKDSPHSHTTVEFQLIHLLNHVVTTGAGIFFLSLQFIACLLYTLSWRPDRAGYCSSVVGVVSLRAPPAGRYNISLTLTALFREIYLVIILSKNENEEIYIFPR